METFSQLVSILLMAFVLVLTVKFIGGSLAHFIRDQFSFQDPNLGWDPTAGMDSSWRTHASPDLNASDWAERRLG